MGWKKTAHWSIIIDRDQRNKAAEIPLFPGGTGRLCTGTRLHTHSGKTGVAMGSSSFLAEFDGPVLEESESQLDLRTAWTLRALMESHCVWPWVFLWARLWKQTWHKWVFEMSLHCWPWPSVLLPLIVGGICVHMVTWLHGCPCGPWPSLKS
jgi:hypothetical protein